MQSNRCDAPLTVALVGLGHRGNGYARYAAKHPDKMKIVAAAEPNRLRLDSARERYDLAPDACFDGYESLAAAPKLADAVINSTMDKMHHASAISLIRAGYHMLLEKPIAESEQEVREILEAAENAGRTVIICHVLRYAPFYQTLKKLVADGRIGEIVSLRTSEHVSYHHMAAAYVRGRWRKEADSTPMLLAKCCHDLDLLAWLMSGHEPVKAASFGSLKQFRPEHAPAGSAERCLEGCRIESTCPYSARLNYVVQNHWGTYAWEAIENLDDPTTEQKLQSLRKDNPYGRCVWHCDNDVVDHQNVIVEFDNGAIASHEMFCATARPTRQVHVIGSAGEIEGDMEAGRITLRKPELAAGRGYAQEEIDIGVRNDGHGGGDERLVADFVAVLQGHRASQGVTHIVDSLTGHRMVFAAEESRRTGRVVEL